MELIHEKLSESIIGAAMHVLNVLKPGLDEKLYENALVIELRKRGHKVDQQRQFNVFYEGQLILQRWVRRSGFPARLKAPIVREFGWFASGWKARPTYAAL